MLSVQNGSIIKTIKASWGVWMRFRILKYFRATVDFKVRNKFKKKKSYIFKIFIQITQNSEMYKKYV